MRIRDWPIEQRPRERLLAGGAAALSDAELLAVLLRTGTAGKHAVELARELLAECGGLHALVCADARGGVEVRPVLPVRFVPLTGRR